MKKRSVDVKEASEAKAPSRGGGRSMVKADLPDLYWYAGLLVLFVVSLVIRTYLPYKNFVIGDTVRFSSESDAWYHMMLAKTTFLHWQRPWFDPLTNFPNGNDLHFGPFMDWSIALIAHVVGLGSANLQTVDMVGLYWPAVLGALLIIPVYLVGKEIGGRGCGLTAAIFVTFLPGQLFSRTTLGFTDHHSSEAFLSTTAMLLFLLAFKASRGMSFSRLSLANLGSLKRPLIYTLTSGLLLGLYIYSWSMGILFVGILLIFVSLQAIVEYFRGNSGDYLGFVPAVAFIVAAIMLLPIAHAYNGFSIIQYSLFQPTMLLAATIFVLEMAFVYRYLRKRRYWALYFPGALLAIVLVDFLILALILPGFTGVVLGGVSTYLTPRSGGAATVAELSPLWLNQGIESNFPGWLLGGFLSPFYLALAGIILLLVRNFTIVERKGEGNGGIQELLLSRRLSLRNERGTDFQVIIWCLVILAITLMANRSAYYYAINVALLCGYAASWLYRLTDFGALEAFLQGILSPQTSQGKASVSISPSQGASMVLVLMLVLAVIVPSVGTSYYMAKYASPPTGDWISAIEWLGGNTPEPGMDIYQVYQRPEEGQPFNYNPEAYGVMSWWDYGHLIETIGRRYPNANPFQQGIGSITAGRPGSSPFFLAENESDAEDVLARLDSNRSLYLNSRYIMTDVEMAMGKFHAIAAWSSVPLNRYTGAVFQEQGEGTWVPIEVWLEPYFRTMVGRMQFFDGTEVAPNDAVGVAYTRVDYEGRQLALLAKAPLFSSNQTELQEFVDQSLSEGLNASIVSTSPLSSPSHVEALQHYRLVHESETPVTNFGHGYVKTFEHVPGVTIRGRAASGTPVIVALPVTTNQNRTFVYRQSNVTGPDGVFTLVVPYSTEGPSLYGTNFDTRPTQPYGLLVGTTGYEIKVPEEMVLMGGVVEI